MSKNYKKEFGNKLKEIATALGYRGNFGRFHSDLSYEIFSQSDKEDHVEAVRKWFSGSNTPTTNWPRLKLALRKLQARKKMNINKKDFEEHLTELCRIYPKASRRQKIDLSPAMDVKKWVKLRWDQSEFYPDWNSFADGDIYAPKDLYNEVLAQLQENKVSLIIGRGASGKSVFGVNIAVRWINQNQSKKKAWWIDLADKREKPEPDIFSRYNKRRLPSILLVVDNAHLNQEVAEHYLNLASECAIRVLFLSRPRPINRAEHQDDLFTRLQSATFDIPVDGKTFKGVAERVLRNESMRLAWAEGDYEEAVNDFGEDLIAFSTAVLKYKADGFINPITRESCRDYIASRYLEPAGHPDRNPGGREFLLEICALASLEIPFGDDLLSGLSLDYLFPDYTKLGLFHQISNGNQRQWGVIHSSLAEMILEFSSYKPVWDVKLIKIISVLRRHIKYIHALSTDWHAGKAPRRDILEGIINSAPDIVSAWYLEDPITSIIIIGEDIGFSDVNKQAIQQCAEKGTEIIVNKLMYRYRVDQYLAHLLEHRVLAFKSIQTQVVLLLRRDDSSIRLSPIFFEKAWLIMPSDERALFVDSMLECLEGKRISRRSLYDHANLINLLIKILPCEHLPKVRDWVMVTLNGLTWSYNNFDFEERYFLEKVIPLLPENYKDSVATKIKIMLREGESINVFYKDVVTDLFKILKEILDNEEYLLELEQLAKWMDMDMVFYRCSDYHCYIDSDIATINLIKEISRELPSEPYCSLLFHRITDVFCNPHHYLIGNIYRRSAIEYIEPFGKFFELCEEILPEIIQVFKFDASPLSYSGCANLVTGREEGILLGETANSVRERIEKLAIEPNLLESSAHLWLLGRILIFSIKQYYDSERLILMDCLEKIIRVPVNCCGFMHLSEISDLLIAAKEIFPKRHNLLVETTLGVVNSENYHQCRDIGDKVEFLYFMAELLPLEDQSFLKEQVNNLFDASVNNIENVVLIMRRLDPLLSFKNKKIAVKQIRSVIENRESIIFIGSIDAIDRFFKHTKGLLPESDHAAIDKQRKEILPEYFH